MPGDITYIELILKNNQPPPTPFKTKAVGLSPSKAPGEQRDLKPNTNSVGEVS